MAPIWRLDRRLRGPASLGAKLVLILTGVGVAGAVAITLLLAAIITPSFNTLEANAIAGHVDRTRAALADYAAKVEGAVRDYGDWNASYDYMGHRTVAFERESFSPLAMTNLNVQGMAYIAPDGGIVIARWLTKNAEDVAMRARLAALIARIDLDKAAGKGNSDSFYARLGGRVAAVGIAKVRRSDGTGHPRGWVLMARVLTSRQISDMLQLATRIGVASAAGTVTPGRTTVAISVPMRGSDALPVASARFSVPRDVSMLGRRMLLLAVAGSTLLLLIVLMVLRRVIARLVLRPLHRVEGHMQHVRASGSMAPLSDDGRRDEIGSLGRSFNAMLRQLRDLRERVEVQSFALGRSESAVAVMHNVRNALNPISTILSQGIAGGPSIDRAMLDRALTELAGEDVAPARRRKLAAFVTAALEAQEAARGTIRAELRIGREAMANVLEIIGQQQAHAHERPRLEPCDVTDIVARNATIARYSAIAAIAFSFPAQPHAVMANRVILSQVIGNLLGNAAESIGAAGRTSGSIVVTVAEGAEGTEVHIRDDGEGFAAGIGNTLFQRGFSTRAHKSGGLGLHWCANAMTAMEGALRLESEGRGSGAVAILTLRRVEEAALARAA